MLRILFSLILGWWGLSFSASTSPIGILPPEIIPEREYGYLKGALYQFLQNQLNEASGVKFASVKDNRLGDKFSTLLESKINFLSPEKVRIELNLREVHTDRSLWKSSQEVATEHFWTTLGQELDSLKRALTQGSQSSNKSQEISSSRVLPSTKPREEKPSLLSRFNPFRLLSGLLPRKDDSLKMKVEVPPPPPPPGYVIGETTPMVSPPQREVILPEVRPQLQTPKETSPWQWW